MTCMYICIANLILKFGFRLLVKDLQPHHNLHLEPQGLAGDLVGHCEKKMKRLFEVWPKAVLQLQSMKTILLVQIEESSSTHSLT